MKKQKPLFLILTAVLVLAFMLSILGGSARASSSNAPKPTKTSTPTSTAPGTTPTPGATQTPGPAPTVSTTELTQGWSLRSALNVTDPGTVISTLGYNVSSWYPITVPSTVMAGLVTNNIYPNVFFGTNLQSVPDLTTQNWWYRGQFNAVAGVAGQQYWLRFKGVSYRAQIWLNGTLLDSNAVGTMVIHEYNVTNLINKGGANAVALLVTPPKHKCLDLSFCTVDWNPEAPDMGQSFPGYDRCDRTARSICENCLAFASNELR